MFMEATAFNQDLSQWDISGISGTGRMFYKAKAFDQDLGDWPIGSIVNMVQMFDSSGLSIRNYDSILIKWQAKTHLSNIWFSGEGLNYCKADSSRSLLLNDGWVFSGDTMNCLTTSLDAVARNDPPFILYPNPTAGVLFLKKTIDIPDQNLYLFNAKGQLLETINVKNEVTRINLSEYSKGIYLIRNNYQFQEVVLVR